MDKKYDEWKTKSEIVRERKKEITLAFVALSNVWPLKRIVLSVAAISSTPVIHAKGGHWVPHTDLQKRGLVPWQWHESFRTETLRSG